MPQDKESDKEKGLEKWLKRLINEPLKPSEETENRREEYSDRNHQGYGADEEEKENYQHGKKLVEKELEPLERKYHQFGRIDLIDKTRLENFIKEERSEGRVYKEFEERYRKLLK